MEAWLASHPDDAARVAEWRAQAEAIRARFGILASEPVPARFDLDKLARSARSWRAIAAAAVVVAFLAGGAVGWGRAGRRVEVVNARGVVEVSEVTRSGQPANERR